MFRSHWICVLVVAGLAAGMVGCDAGGDTIPVTGLVTLDGEPVAGAAVTFSPQSPGGVAAAGMTDNAGRFSLTTTGGEGAQPGSYAVTIIKSAAAGAPAGPDPRERGPDLTAEQRQAMSDAAKAHTARKSAPAEQATTIPERYASADTSGFKAEVKPGQKNDFPFEMTSQ